jgi:transcriptional regulator with XRE-family HTH domain
MGIKEAVVLRLKNLCSEKDIKINALATLSGVTPSSVYSSLEDSRKDVGIVLIKKLCDGLDITITEFFDDEIFKGLEQEII